MCGIAGIIHRGKPTNIGSEMSAMLQSMRHRGPDSTGYAVYGLPEAGEIVMRFKVAEREDMDRGFEIHRQVKERRAEVDARIQSLGGEIVSAEEGTEYAFRYQIKYAGDLRRLADYIEDVEGAEILSLGSALELIKDLGDANQVCGQYRL
ncbi:MAG: glutamine amidotransferase, partial [Chloroflexi bacterium]|nr:glutamine amidotransferase [Chloroflexota bacterium]